MISRVLIAVKSFQMIDPGGIIGHKADIFVVARAHKALLGAQTRLHQAVAPCAEGFRFRGHGIEVRRRVEQAQPPKCFEGLPITLVAAAVTSLSFMGFGGIVEAIFG